MLPDERSVEDLQVDNGLRSGPSAVDLILIVVIVRCSKGIAPLQHILASTDKPWLQLRLPEADICLIRLGIVDHHAVAVLDVDITGYLQGRLELVALADTVLAVFLRQHVHLLGIPVPQGVTIATDGHVLIPAERMVELHAEGPIGCGNWSCNGRLFGSPSGY